MRRGGNIVTIETLKRQAESGKPGNFTFAVFIHRYDCANDTKDTLVEAVASLEKFNRFGEVYWDGKVNPRGKIITINGVRYWWNPNPSLRSRVFEMEPVRMGSYGAEIQDAVCSNVR